MTAGDAGLERQALRPWSEVEPGLRRRTEAGLQPRLWEVRALLAQLTAQQAVVDAARAAVSEYFDILEAQQREILGDDAQGIIEEMEQSTTGTRRLAEARRTVYALLGRTAQAAQPEGERA